MSVTALSVRRLEHELERIRSAVIGDDTVLEGPFGARRLVYADHTASGRSLSFVEDVIREQVLPLYANTHTEASTTGRWTTQLREDARKAIHRAVGGGEDDVVVFFGSGSTAAVDRLLRVRSSAPAATARSSSSAPSSTIRTSCRGGVPRRGRRHRARRRGSPRSRPPARRARAARTRPLKIGRFSAASNVTGIVTDVDAVSILLHRYGALACWDYAAAAPHLPVDMNAAPDVEDGVLAATRTPSSFLRTSCPGHGTPGVLVAKCHLLANEVPAVPGGGTILTSHPSTRRTIQARVVREKERHPGDHRVDPRRSGLPASRAGRPGDDPGDRGGIRPTGAGLVAPESRLLLLGNPDLPRVPIVSFGVRHPLEAHLRGCCIRNPWCAPR